MIKKIFFLALMLGVTFFASATATVKNPAADPNLVLFYQHQGLESYFMRDSLQSSQKDSLQVISFKFIVYDSIRPENTHWATKLLIKI